MVLYTFGGGGEFIIRVESSCCMTLTRGFKSDPSWGPLQLIGGNMGPLAI